MVHCIVNAPVYSRSSDVCFDYDGPASLGHLDTVLFEQMGEVAGCFIACKAKNVKKKIMHTLLEFNRNWKEFHHFY